jgi:hypothetical protein
MKKKSFSKFFWVALVHICAIQKEKEKKEEKEEK